MSIDNKEIIVGIQRLILENERLKEDLVTFQFWKEDAIKYLEKGEVAPALNMLDHGIPF